MNKFADIARAVTRGITEPVGRKDGVMGKRLLIIAYHFPPVQESSGVLRTLSFAKYLPKCGWQVSVLTVNPRAYISVREENMRMVPANTEVFRAFALDAQRHCSFRGRYPSWLAVPDRWQSWIASGILLGLKVIRQSRPDAIFSTFPISSAHFIGLALHKLTGLPWIADLRDPMTDVPTPTNPMVRRVNAWMERQIAENASLITVTTRGAQDLYRNRYPALRPESIALVANGFDEEQLGIIPETQSGRAPAARIRLLHSGVIYPQQRNPESFFGALSKLKKERCIDSASLEVVLRASGNEEAYQKRIRELDIDDIVVLKPAVTYAEAIREMREVDGLVLLQSRECAGQIPAKLYEYIYIHKPILGITDAEGDTGKLLAELGMNMMAPLEDLEAIRAIIPEFLRQIRDGSAMLPSAEYARSFSRRNRARELAELIEAVAVDGG